MSQTGVSVNGFGPWLRKRIVARRMNQSEFAEKVGTSTGTVSMWVTGKRIPDPSSCDRIADALGVDLDIVLFQAGHRPQTEPIDPDDPKNDIMGMVERIDWKSDPGSVRLVSRVLRTIIEDQRGEIR